MQCNVMQLETVWHFLSKLEVTKTMIKLVLEIQFFKVTNCLAVFNCKLKLGKLTEKDHFFLSACHFDLNWKRFELYVSYAIVSYRESDCVVLSISIT